MSALGFDGPRWTATPGGAAINWEFWIDVGGTFTDCIARRPDGSIATHKLLSTGVYKGVVGDGSTAAQIVDLGRQRDPDDFFRGWQLTLLDDHLEMSRRRRDDPAVASRVGMASLSPAPAAVLDSGVPVVEAAASHGVLRLGRPLAVAPWRGLRYELRCDEPAPIVGIRWLMGKRLDVPLGPVVVRLGTTRGTNALLERQGAATALVTTAGFADVLRIAYQNRPRLFELEIRKPGELYQDVVEIDERLDAEGRPLRVPDPADVRRRLAPLAQRGVRSLAICLLHAYRNGAHEELVAAVARELGFEQVSISSRLSPLPRIVSRGDTTVVDAYLTPILREYVASIAARMPQAALKLMTSAGSLVDAAQFVGKDSILSGPAGGVVGAAHVARVAGFARVIGFDMGGTSTDVSRFDGQYERRYEMEVNDPESGAGVRIVAPMLAVETVAAGGGSICAFDGQKPVVGPRSAGADPGPACYGRGGPLCVTDVNLHLGKLVPEHFPFPLDRAAVEWRLNELIEQIERATGRRYTADELAAGFSAIANANMIAPIKKISIARGYDVREYTLVSFGGAGAQHACAIARELGMHRVLCSPYAGVLSALGIGMADVTKFAERAVGGVQMDPSAGSSAEQPPWAPPARLEALFGEMATELREQVRAEGVPADRIRPPRRLLDMRYAGQDSRITVPCPPDGDYRREFERLHRQLYGFTFPERPVEVYAARVEVMGETDKPATRALSTRIGRPAPHGQSRAYFAGRWHDTAVYLRAQLQPGDQIAGPAIIAEPLATIVVEPDWSARVTEHDDVLLEWRPDVRSGMPAAATRRAGTAAEPAPDPIELELFNNHFASIAEQMGATLQKTALSTNVKERLDFSCAIFSPAGDLVVNAPHIPVHLGAMSECVKRLMEDVPDMRPGEVYVTNDPFRGGSHLPDVTVVTPVFEVTTAADPMAPATRPGVLFFTASRAHHAEIGGVTPGSMPPFSRTLAEEGVLIRHFRLVQQAKSTEHDLRRLLTAGPYPTRAADENIADINAQVAANQTGVQLLLEMVAQHGLGQVQAYMQHIQRAAENQMRAALRRIAPGEHRFTDYLDDGSPITVCITVRHVERHGRLGGEAIVDFAGTGPVLAGNLNANSAIVSSAVIYCFRCLIDQPIPLNAGVLAPIEIRLPENCLLNPPADPDPSRCPAVVGGNVETSPRVVDAIFGALQVVAASQGTMNNLIFGRSGAAGRAADTTQQPPSELVPDPSRRQAAELPAGPGTGTGRAFGYYETICGGAGAGPTFHGADAVHTHMTNTRLTDPEVLEGRYPVRLRQFSIRRGSGGAGQHHGGDGIVREIEFLEAVSVSLLTSRRTTAPYGLQGGSPGQPGRNRLRRLGGEVFEELPGAALVQVQAGDVLRIETPGGGGYGAAQRR
jgi:5-oxoprolinase (ATP-hydrolysing)